VVKQIYWAKEASVKLYLTGYICRAHIFNAITIKPNKPMCFNSNPIVGLFSKIDHCHFRPNYSIRTHMELFVKNTANRTIEFRLLFSLLIPISEFQFFFFFFYSNSPFPSLVYFGMNYFSLGAKRTNSNVLIANNNRTAVYNWLHISLVWAKLCLFSKTDYFRFYDGPFPLKFFPNNTTPGKQYVPYAANECTF